MTNPPVPDPEPHGGDGVRIATALGLDPSTILDLSATLNPFAPDVTNLVARVAHTVHHYPDVAEGERTMAGRLGVESSRVVLTNGGSEAIALVAGMWPSGRVDEPEFSLYRRHLTLDPDGPRWRSNPNNPLGTLAGEDETAAVWDEAFWPLATGTWTRGDADDGSIAIGSLTKLYACPGLRIGYVLAPDAATAELVRLRRPEWSVSTLALAALPHLLATTDLTGWAAQVRAVRSDLASALTRRGFDVAVADAPWVLVHDAPDLREQLAPHGIIVRDCTNFGLPGTVRIAVPPASALDRVVTALDALRASV